MEKIILPASKSIALRVMIMNAVSRLCGGGTARLEGHLSGEDIEGLQRALDALFEILEKGESEPAQIYIGEGGAPMRFFTALAAVCGGVDLEVTGSARLNERPMAILIEALRRLGAEIVCLEREGFPPLGIHGVSDEGEETRAVEMDGWVSSQYISALMMTAPMRRAGLRIRLTGGKIVSRPYLAMTDGVMERFGVETEVTAGNGMVEIYIPAQRPKAPERMVVEADWSAASYFYELSTLLPGEKIEIAALRPADKSLQGDAKCAEYFRYAGVVTTYNEDGSATLCCDAKMQEFYRNEIRPGETLSIDMGDTPDLVPAMCVSFCLAGIPFNFRGVDHLRHKESNRLAALTAEMRKLGYVLESPYDDQLEWKGERCEAERVPKILTYNDHRMAMAFAPAWRRYPEMMIQNPGVIGKSFPDFFMELGKV